MLIDGKKMADQIQEEIKAHLSQLKGRKPTLAVILIGHHTPSLIYVERKGKACESVGIHFYKQQLPESITEIELIQEIEKLNQNDEIDGILVQLPLPPHINAHKITHCISAKKDVDGFHPINMGKLLIGEQDGFVPCTPLGIKVMLERSEIEVSGKQLLVIGRSNIVGKPVAALFMQSKEGANATVTIAHRFTPNMTALTKMADIIIVAIGKPKFLTGEMVKEGVVVVDVGINKVNDSSKRGYQIVGDVDFESVEPKSSYITPVPGGVGPMTIAMLLQNTLFSYLKSLGVK